LGTIFTSHPGNGSPITPGRSISKCTIVIAGAVSVEPQADTIGTRLPVAAMATFSSRSQRFCGSAAAA
jgi:hypothetical protein